LRYQFVNRSIHSFPTRRSSDLYVKLKTTIYQEVFNMKEILKVEGMSCGHCVNSIETNVGELTGVSAVKVDLANKEVAVEFDNARSEEHTSELQSRENLVCRLLL